MRLFAKCRCQGRAADICAECSGASIWVRPMSLPGCSGAARRGAGFTLCKRGKMRFFSKGISAVPGAEGAPLRCRNAYTVVPTGSRPLWGRQPGHFLESGSLTPPPAALRRFPTFSFVLAKDKVNCPKGKRGAPGGKRAAPGTKANRLLPVF